MKQASLKQSRQTMNESKSKVDRPSLIPHNLFVAWSRDSEHKSIHYLSTEVQGSSTSWLDQACKWCMHFPVQMHKTDIQHLSTVRAMNTKVSADQMDTVFSLFLVGLGWREGFSFILNHVLCINIWWYQHENNPLLLVVQEMCPPGSSNVSTKKGTNARKQDKYLDCIYGYEYIFAKICKPN